MTPIFASKSLWATKIISISKGLYNKQNSRYWSEEQPLLIMKGNLTDVE